MRAVGFGEPEETIVDGRRRCSIHLKGTEKLIKKGKTLKFPIDLKNNLKSKRDDIELEIVALEGAPSVSAAIREMRVHHSLSESRAAAETALALVRGILTTPKDFRVYRVKRGNPVFLRNLGRLQGSAVLMRSIGFTTPAGATRADSGGEGGVYVFKSLSSDGPDTVMTTAEDDNNLGGRNLLHIYLRK